MFNRNPPIKKQFLGSGFENCQAPKARQEGDGEGQLLGLEECNTAVVNHSFLGAEA